MKLINKLLTILTTSTLLLTACQTTPSNTLTFTPSAPTAIFNVNNQNAIVNVVTKDIRARPEVSSYVLNGELFKLTASPDVSTLFQQVVQQNLNSKGVRLGTPNTSNTNIIVNVKEFYAKVDQGNLRYKIAARIQVDINVQGAKGNFTKNLGATHTVEGALNANNDKIKKVLDATFKETVAAIYADQEITNAILQYSN